jgi:Tfp pilus assembly protein PilX
MKTTHSKSLKKNELGMVAIVITSVLMIVISLIILGFTQTIRREQRQALDRQLSTQAFYAAESGVNLARKVINEQLDNGEATDKNSCEESGRYTGKYAIDSSTGSEITCLLVNPFLEKYEYQGVSTDSKVVRLTGNGGVAIPRIGISWQSNSPSAYTGCSAGIPAVPFPAAWGCSEPVLRIDLVPLNGSLTQASLQASQFTSFLYPINGGGVTSIPSGNGTGANIGTISAVKCANAPAAGYKYRCTAEIQIAAPVNSYGLRMQGIYKPAAVSIGATDSSGNPITLINGQIIIDSTAKAVDVVRRLQARINVNSGVNDSPDFAIETGGALGLCKQYTITGGVYSWPAGTGCSIP